MLGRRGSIDLMWFALGVAAILAALSTYCYLLGVNDGRAFERERIERKWFGEQVREAHR